MVTMTDDVCVRRYVEIVFDCWKTFYNNKRESVRNNRVNAVTARIGALTRAVRTIHMMCKISPIINFNDAGNAAPLLNGVFEANTWAIKLNHIRIGSPTSAEEFMNLVETLYHEARHTEQFWLIACGLTVHLKKTYRLVDVSKELVQTLHIPLEIARQASQQGRNFNPSNELSSKIINWYKSIYVNPHQFDSAVTIQKIKSNPFLDDYESRKTAFEIEYNKYRYSAHEADAFDIQLLVRNKLTPLLLADKDLITW